MRSANFFARYLIAATGASLIPGAAWACPACMVGDPKTAGTYLGMTLALSALPMLLVCGLGYWLWRRHS
ncbi:MAG TPA: hypothetical protein VGT24_06875 [Candidatus Acidoferrales bacterium]|nr:hypothetical protein [Candidatus Acidoferrales bacterium]